MKKRILAWLVLFALVFAMTGCTGTNESEESKKPDESASVESSKEADSEHPGWLTEEKKTLKVLTNEGSGTSNPPASNDLPFWKWLEEYTNVHIEWEIASTSGYNEVVSTRLSAGVDLPDIMMVNTLPLAEKAGMNGILVDLAEYWDTCFTNTSAYWDSQDVDFLSYVTSSDGAIYALVGMAEPVEGHITLAYNKEWLEKLNAEVPTTLDEFTDLLYKMKEAGDLNGNGVNDEIVLTSSGVSDLTSSLGTAFGLEQYEAWDAFVADENGVVKDEYTSENMKNFLAYLRRIYKDRLLDQEISSMSANTLAEKIASDRVGIFAYYSEYAIIFGQLTSKGQQDPFSEVYSLGGALASEYNGNKGYFMRRERAVGAPTAITDECKDVELAARWLDTLYADPNVLNVRVYGIEGEDWRYDENGEIEILFPEDGSIRDIGAKGCGQIPLCHFQTREQLLAGNEQYPWYLEEYEKMRTESDWKSPSVKHITLYSDEENELISFVSTDVKGVFGEYRDKFIKGSADVNADWDKYVSEINKMGLPDMIKGWQMIHDRTKQ